MRVLRMQRSGNSTIAVEGHIDPQFAQVLKAFITNFERGREIGAAVAVYHRNKLVVDLAGGSSRSALTCWNPPIVEIHHSLLNESLINSDI